MAWRTAKNRASPTPRSDHPRTSPSLKLFVKVVLLVSLSRSGKINRKDAALPRQVAHTKFASVRFNATAADTEAQPQTRPVAASLLEHSKQIFGIPERETATFVFNFDQDAIARRKRLQRNAAVRLCELESVLQQIRHCPRQDLAVGFDGQSRLDIWNDKLEAACLRIDGGGYLALLDEF
jgi:hypothetical protein